MTFPRVSVNRPCENRLLDLSIGGPNGTRYEISLNGIVHPKIMTKLSSFTHPYMVSNLDAIIFFPPLKIKGDFFVGTHVALFHQITGHSECSYQSKKETYIFFYFFI